MAGQARDQTEPPRHMVEFHQRGAFSRHEIRVARHMARAYMAFRGKGYKIEHRSSRSIARRMNG